MNLAGNHLGASIERLENMSNINLVNPKSTIANLDFHHLSAARQCVEISRNAIQRLSPLYFTAFLIRFSRHNESIDPVLGVPRKRTREKT